MNADTISPSVLSLVHHVELNQSGWWDRVVQQVLLAQLHEAESSLTREALRERIETVLRRSLDDDYLEMQISAVVNHGYATELPDGAFRISEAALSRVNEGVVAAEANRQTIMERFADELAQRGIDVDPVTAWELFEAHALIPMVEELGARTYQILSRSELPQETGTHMSAFLDHYSEELHGDLREAAIAMLDPHDPAVRSHVLKQLNTRFVLDAAGLRREVLEQLAGDEVRGKKRKILLFIDTNFLFSLLELHSNPANEAAKALLELLQQISEFFTVSLYVVPTTLDEARDRIGVEMDRLKGLVLTPKLAKAVHQGEMSGLAHKYVEEIARGAIRMTPKEFFGPYYNDLLSFARARGIELYNVRMEDVERSQAVIDDTLERLEFEKNKYGDRAKSYEQLLHDVALWHLTRSKRPARVESPLQAAAWVVTVDFRLLGFDRYKQRRGSGQVPLCVHPAVLIQLLQFWIPRTPEFEEALVASLRLPFFFQDFDPEAERVTVKILGTLGRFQNVDRLPDKTISNVLANQALRRRLEAPASVEEQIKLVESTILEENAKLQERMQREASRRKEAETELKSFRKSLDEISDRLTGREAAVTDLMRQLEEREQQITTLERTVQEGMGERARREHIERFLSRVLVPVVLGAVPAAVLFTSALISVTGMSVFLAAFMGGGGVLILALLLIEYNGRKNHTITSTEAYQWLRHARTWLLALLAIIATYVFSEVAGRPIVDWIQNIVAE